MAMKWHIYIKGGYLATVIAPLSAIKQAFPYAEITGNCVNVWMMSRRLKRRSICANIKRSGNASKR